jgi:hypothetical protein
MRRLLHGSIPLLLLSALVPAAGAGVGQGELTLLAGAASGDLGTELDTGSQWLTLRYITGDDLQFRADLSMVRAAYASAVRFSGPAPAAASGGDGRRRGNGEASTGDGTTTGPVLLESTATGLGDLYLAVSRRLAGGGVRLFRMDANFEVKVPLADADDNLGTGEWDYRLGLAAEYRFWAVTAYGGAGWNRLGDPSWVDLQDVVDVFVGVEGDPIAGGRVGLGGWVEAVQETVDLEGYRAAVGFGLRTTGRTRWRVQVRAGLTDATADLGLLVGVSFGVSAPGPGIRGPQL